jgi:O-antigen/teichoic acid export membrane protein
VFGYLQRLLRTSAAYQASDLVAKVIAVGTLPVYTRHLSRADYGAAETLLTGVIFWSILLRLGVGEAFVRFYFNDADPERRARLARLATAFVFATTSVAALVAAAFAGSLSDLVLGYRDATLMRIALLGLWTFTNLEVAYSLLRVDERARAYLVASVANVLLTVALTVYLVVVRDERARGLLAGNFVASTVILLGLWVLLRERLGLRLRMSDLPLLLRFGLPTVPADASVYALNVIDRVYLFRVHSPSAAGLYALAVKLATVVTIAVRGYQYAWPPLAYSVTDDAQAARLYAVVATYYTLATGFMVAVVTLLGRWGVRLLAAPSFYGAHVALPWLALGWAMYGLFLVFVVMAGRARVTTRNFPAALAGLVVNVVLLVTLVDPLGIAGAGIALCGAYLVMLAAMFIFTRRLFRVDFEWGRLGQLLIILGGVAVGGELLLPTSGASGLLLRAGAVTLIPLLLLLTGFVRPNELARARQLMATARARPDPPSDDQAQAGPGPR